ncbi:MAG: DNA adenine methylase [Anaerolineae bacterium]|nr:DNA adenine methylase [Anaerolineae bacterium]
MAQQLSLFSPHSERPFNYPFPSTRYQGSKRALVNWIWDNVSHLKFDSVLDVFGGTGAVSYLFKNAGKRVIYNDALAFNWMIGKALIENRSETLSDADLDAILIPNSDMHYPDFIQKTFQNIYFTDDENAWLDKVVHHIDHTLTNSYRQAIARFALCQACIIKRPYNLFHRANLYIRTAKVERSFGNKTTWDTPFEVHFRKFVAEANRAIFDNHQPNSAIQTDALMTPVGADLVYIDPPYLNQHGTGVDYRDFYHFLEGMMNYDDWHAHIDYHSKHRRLTPQESDWNQPKTILSAFEKLIARHQNSILVISYRDDGIPSKADLIALLKSYKSEVHEAQKSQQYVLSNKKSHEDLLIGL